jgi:hypothetical protein
MMATSLSTLPIAPALKGLQQAKILRAMLRLPSFTRKELAEETGEDISLVNGVVGRQRHLLNEIKQQHSGSRGAPETILALKPEARNALLEELRPLYGELEAKWGAAQDLHSYVPRSLEFRVAQELIDKFDSHKPGSKMTAPDVSRILELLRTASRREDLPTESKLGEYVTAPEELSVQQQVAKARTDALKAKLCWLAAGSMDEAIKDQFADTPIVAGISYLTSAVRALRQHNVEEVAQSLEFWSINHVWPSLVGSFYSAWSGSIIEALKSKVDRTVLPRLAAELKMVLEPPRSRIAEGLVCAYDQFYGPTAGKVVGLLDLRNAASTFAIVDDAVLRFHTYTPLEDPGDRMTLPDLDEALDKAERALVFYQQSNGKPVEELLVAGTEALSIDFRALAHKLGPTLRVHMMDLPELRSVEKKSLAAYAAEIGLAVQASHCASKVVKELSNASAATSVVDGTALARA